MRHPYIVEEYEVLAAADLVAGYQVHPLESHARRIASDHHERDVLVTRRIRVRVHEREQPVWLAASAHELLRAVDDPLVTVTHATRP
jgi:hypothetical protein